MKRSIVEFFKKIAEDHRDGFCLLSLRVGPHVFAKGPSKVMPPRPWPGVELLRLLINCPVFKFCWLSWWFGELKPKVLPHFVSRWKWFPLF